VWAYDELVTEALQLNPKTNPRIVKEAIAEHVNNSFGGQHWRAMFVGKKGERIARAFLLAPDWTLSNLKVAADVFGNMRFGPNDLWRRARTKMGGAPVTAEELLRTDIRATFARQYALRAGLMFATMAGLANYALTSIGGGEGHFMDENAEGFKTSLELPGTDSRGRKRYLKFGKQFREPFEWVWNPLGSVRRKASPVARVFNMVYSGRDYFGKPLYTAEDGPVRSLANSAWEIITEAPPISMQKAFEGAGHPTDRVLESFFGAAGLPVRTEQINQRASQGNLSNEDYLRALTQAGRSTPGGINLAALPTR
jgi:hypothetical protein